MSRWREVNGNFPRHCERSDEPGLPFSVVARSEATKQSILSSATSMDCFAPLAMTRSMGRDASRRRSDRAVTVPFGRHCSGWEVAYAALFLISNESSYVNATHCYLMPSYGRNRARLACDIRIARGIAGLIKNTHLLLTSNLFRNPMK
jgi:hypothetical protein